MVGHRFGNEAKRVVLPPLCSFLLEAVDNQLVDFLGALHICNISIDKLTAIILILTDPRIACSILKAIGLMVETRTMYHAKEGRRMTSLSK